MNIKDEIDSIKFVQFVTSNIPKGTSSAAVVLGLAVLVSAAIKASGDKFKQRNFDLFVERVRQDLWRDN